MSEATPTSSPIPQSESPSLTPSNSLLSGYLIINEIQIPMQKAPRMRDRVIFECEEVEGEWQVTGEALIKKEIYAPAN